MIFLVLAGCMAGLDLGRATTLAPGVSRVGGGTELQLLNVDQQPGESTFPVPWVQAMGGWHLGLPKDWEVGARVWGMGIPGIFSKVGAGVEAKHLVHRSSRKADPHVAIGASVWGELPFFGGQPWQVGGITVPVFLGYDIKRSQLVMTPRVSAILEGGYGQSPVPAVAFGTGLAWDIAAGKRFHITPEFVWTWSPLPFNGEVSDPDRNGAHAFETGVVVSWEVGQPKTVSRAGATRGTP